MSRSVILVVLLALAGAVPAAAGEDPGPPGEGLFFRLEPGLAPGSVVEGQLARTTGPEGPFDAAFLDLDGDGVPEARQALGEVARPGSKSAVREYRLRVPAVGGIFSLEIEAFRSAAAAADLGPGSTRVNWSVRSGGLAVHFIGASLSLFATAREARAEAPLRLGSPVTVDLTPGTRGSSTLVVIAVKDVNGADLGTVYRDGKELRPEVKVLRDGVELVSATPGYS